MARDSDYLTSRAMVSAKVAAMVVKLMETTDEWCDSMRSEKDSAPPSVDLAEERFAGEQSKKNWNSKRCLTTTIDSAYCPKEPDRTP